MGRDNLGDDTPPDEINIIEQGKNYGWPIFYGQNIHDTNFDKNVYIQDPCNDKIKPHIEFPAHSAPLGFAFVTSSNWPADYKNNIIVAFHGSWNRSVPTGYKLARVKLDSKGNYIGIEDFISGWLAKDGKTSLGRPVDVFFAKDGSLFVTDDKIGALYKITFFRNK
jgi:glucose/arabinose dehydrogenase